MRPTMKNTDICRTKFFEHKVVYACMRRGIYQQGQSPSINQRVVNAMQKISETVGQQP